MNGFVQHAYAIVSRHAALRLRLRCGHSQCCCHGGDPWRSRRHGCLAVWPCEGCASRSLSGVDDLGGSQPGGRFGRQRGAGQGALKCEGPLTGADHPQIVRIRHTSAGRPCRSRIATRSREPRHTGDGGFQAPIQAKRYRKRPFARPSVSGFEGSALGPSDGIADGCVFHAKDVLRSPDGMGKRLALTGAIFHVATSSIVNLMRLGRGQKQRLPQRPACQERPRGA